MKPYYGTNGRILKPFQMKSGCFQIRFWEKNKESSRLLHRVVAHAFIPNSDNKPEVDHKNRDPSDNRAENLRWATRQENEFNKQKYKNNTTGFKGVMRHVCGKYQATMTFNKTTIYLGLFNTAEEASSVYRQECEKLHGDFISQ